MSHQYSPGISLNRTPLNTTRANNRPKNLSCVQLLQFIVSELKITRQIRIPNIYLFCSKFLYFKRRNRIYNKSQRHFIDRRKIRSFFKIHRDTCTMYVSSLPPPSLSPSLCMFIIPLYYNKDPGLSRYFNFKHGNLYSTAGVNFQFYHDLQSDYARHEYIPGYILIYPSYTLKLRIPPLFHYHIYDIDAFSPPLK